MTASDIAVLKSLRRAWLLNAADVGAIMLLIILAAIGQMYGIWYLLGMPGVIGVSVFVIAAMLLTGFNPPTPVFIIFMPLVCVCFGLITLVSIVQDRDLLKLPRIVTLAGFKEARSEASGYRINLECGKEYVITPSGSRKGKYDMQSERVNYHDQSLADLAGFID